MTSVALAVLLMAPPQAEAITLRVKPRRGSTHIYSTISTVTTKMTASTGTPIESLVKASMKAIEVTDKQVRFEATIDDVKAGGAESIKGSKLIYTMTPLGELVDVSSEGEGQVLPAIANGLKGSLKLTPRFSEQPVKAGDSWSIELDLAPVFVSSFGAAATLKGDAKAAMNCTLESIPAEGRNRFAVIKHTMAKEVIVLFGVNEVTLTWNVEGTTRYEVATGMIVKQDTIQSQTFTRPGETSPMMSVSIVSKVNLEPK